MMSLRNAKLFCLFVIDISGFLSFCCNITKKLQSSTTKQHTQRVPNAQNKSTKPPLPTTPPVLESMFFFECKKKVYTDELHK